MTTLKIKYPRRREDESDLDFAKRHRAEYSLIEAYRKAEKESRGYDVVEVQKLTLKFRSMKISAHHIQDVEYLAGCIARAAKKVRREQDRVRLLEELEKRGIV